jgi:hypothetical protein
VCGEREKECGRERERERGGKSDDCGRSDLTSNELRVLDFVSREKERSRILIFSEKSESQKITI